MRKFSKHASPRNYVTSSTYVTSSKHATSSTYVTPPITVVTPTTCFVLLLLACLAISCAGVLSATALSPTCSFPDYVQNSPDDSADYWHFHALRSGDAVKVTFGRGVMTMTSEKFTVSDNNALSATCKGRHNDTFLLVSNTGSFWLCVHLRLLTSNLIEFSTGKPHDSQGHRICTGEDHVTLDMPLIANRCRGNTMNACPLGGTYTFHTTECHLHESSSGGDKGDCLCAWNSPPSLLEIGNQAGEMTFAGLSCVPSRSTRRRAMTFHCLGSWTPGGSDDVNVLLGEDGDRPSWCLTYPRDHGDTFTLRLYHGLVCSATHGNVSFVQLRLHRLYPSSQSRDGGRDIAASREVSSTHEMPSEGTRADSGRCRTVVIAMGSLASLLCFLALLGARRVLRRHKTPPYRVLVLSKLTDL